MMKRLLILLIAAISLGACSKSTSPAPEQNGGTHNGGNGNTGGGTDTTGTGTGTNTGTGTGTGNGNGNGTGTGTNTNNQPIIEFYKMFGIEVSMNGSIINNTKLAIYVPNLNAASLKFKLGGKIKIEFKNIPTGSMNNETDGYATTYYPTNVFPASGGDPIASDTLKYVVAKVIDPSYKDAATGKQKIKFVFLTDAGPYGGIGLINAVKTAPVNGSEITPAIGRSDYLAY